jgi:hypothetical protein
MFVTVAIIAGFLGVSAANAQNTGCYTLASLQGNFAGVATYGANVAIAFGPRIYDGNGNFTGHYLLNGPTTGSTTGARTISTGTQKGTYTINCDGSGVINRLLTASDGTTATQTDDFVITESVVQNGQLLATAHVDAVRTPSVLVPGGIFLDRTARRRPDGGCYTA